MGKKLRISFVLPPFSDKPIGGYKLIYQYANFFASRGNKVTIYHMMSSSRRGIPNPIRKVVHQFKKRKIQINWFKLNPKVICKFDVYKNGDFGNSDVVIASAISTSSFVCNLPSKCGKKFYFVQNYEDWGDYNAKNVDDSYKLPMTKIVISKWLSDIVEKIDGKKPYLVPNFVSTKTFYPDTSESKRRSVVSILNHPEQTKRTDFGLEVLKKVKIQVPSLEVKLFGAYTKPSNLPSWVTYYYNPSQDDLRKDIYSKSMVYLMPSVLEGWGLTGMEAMACGAVPVATRYGGMLDFMHDSVDAKLATKDAFDEFVDDTVDILTHYSDYERLSSAAKSVTSRYSILKSGTMFLEILEMKMNKTANN